VGVTRRHFQYKRRLPDHERALWRTFVITHMRTIRTLDDELRTQHGLDIASFEVLYELVNAPDNQLRMADLAERLVYTRSGVTRIVDRLADRGYLERCTADNDARGVYAILTQEGFDVFDAAANDHVAGVRRLFLDPVGEDAPLLARLLARLHAAAG
jgi:DNA-binding MarR family transcriptional regulator